MQMSLQSTVHIVLLHSAVLSRYVSLHFKQVPVLLQEKATQGRLKYNTFAAAFSARCRSCVARLSALVGFFFSSAACWPDCCPPCCLLGFLSPGDWLPAVVREGIAWAFAGSVDRRSITAQATVCKNDVLERVLPRLKKGFN